MWRYIDPAPLVADIARTVNHLHKKFGDCTVAKTLETVIKQISEMPSADVAPVVHAHWESTPYYDNNEEACYDILTCSHCKYPFTGYEYTFIKFYHDKLCPECGAIMDEETEN